MNDAPLTSSGINIIVVGIIACEIGFWVILGLGLVARYLLRLKRVSSVLLLCVPVLDAALLALITWDLVGNGTTADFAHGLGAVYLGFTVAFGHRTIRSIDAWFHHRFAGGPVPVKPPKSGRARVRYEWVFWLQMLLCAVIASAVLCGMVVLVGDADRTAELLAWFGRVWLVTGIWFVCWPVWETIRFVSTGEKSPAVAPRQ